MIVTRLASATRRRDVVHSMILVCVDSIAMIAAFEMGRAIRGSLDRPFANVISQGRFLELMVVTLPLWITIFTICGLYRVPVNGGRLSELGRVVAAVLGGTMLLLSIAYLDYKTAIFPSRLVVVYAVLIGIPLVVAFRQLVRSAMKQVYKRGRGLHNVIIVGTGQVAQRISSELNRRGSGYRLLAAVHTGPGPAPSELGGAQVYGSLESALSAVDGSHIDEILQADPHVPHEQAARMMAFANANGVTYRFVPDTYGTYAAASTLGVIDGIPVIEVRLTALDGWGAVDKRCLDVVGAALLIVLLSPVMALLALTIKLSEPHAPVLYKHRRIGRRGREIEAWKFRTMQWKYSPGPDRPYKSTEEVLRAMGHSELVSEFLVNYKLASDPRVTKLGGFLRRSSLDELPQLFNALSGDLSLVGPRPITHQELDRYGAQAQSFLALKPGITGLWQVYGRSGTSYEERVKLDLYYVENWSVGLDLSILARTFVSVAARRGAV